MPEKGLNLRLLNVFVEDCERPREPRVLHANTENETFPSLVLTDVFICVLFTEVLLFGLGGSGL